MALLHKTLAELTVEDERSMSHVAIYGRLRRWLQSANVRFAVMDHARPDHALVLNLAFWRPGDLAEVLADDVIVADQLAHNAWHALAAARLEGAARSPAGLLLAESIASAFDIYLVGRLLGHAPGSAFLSSQVPAMADAVLEAGLDEPRFEALLERASEEPEQAFEALRQLLFDTSTRLLAATELEEAAAVLEATEDHPFAALLHHYELSTWVLFARCYGHGVDDAAIAVDRALRAADDSMAWLEEHWLGDG